MYATISETDSQIKKEILTMLRINDQNDKFIQIYKQTKDSKMQKEILHNLAFNGSTGNTGFMLDVYKTADKATKKVIIQSFLIQDNPQALLSLLKTESDNDLKKNNHPNP